MSPTAFAPMALIDPLPPSPHNMDDEPFIVPRTTTFSMPDWTRKATYKCGRRLPQTIAHRGFKAQYPENTLAAFRGAIDVHAHAIETDIHLSKDGVVVISHDADLKRCFGINRKIVDCDWEFLSNIRTLKEPHEPMPRLVDLLELVALPENSNIWLLLDIKLDNNVDDVMRLIAEAIHSVRPSPQRQWQDRVVLGCWLANFLPACVKYLPGFPITHIGFSISYARQFLQIPNISFNMLQKALMGPYGQKFIRDVRKANRPLFLWTVDDEDMMRWSIRKEVDGVITDDPEKFRKLLEHYDEADKLTITWKSLLDILRINFFVAIFSILFRYKYGFTIQSQLRDGLAARKQ